MSNTTKTIKELRSEVEALGIPMPATDKMTVEDVKSTLAAAIEAAKATASKAAGDGEHSPVEAKDADAVKDMMQMMSEMRKEMAKRDAAIDDMRKRLDAKIAVAAPESSSANLLMDPSIRLALKAIGEKSTNEKGLLRMEYANEDDKLKEPIVFYTNKRNQRLHQVFIAGQPVAPPLNMDVVRFRPLFWFRNPKTNKVDTRGELVVQSKQLAEWIRKSNKYGIEIFESIEEVMQLSDNSTWADARDRILSGLRLKSDSDIDRMASQYSIPIGRGADYFQIRKAIAEKMTDEQMALGNQAQVEHNVFRQHSEAIMRQHLAGNIPVVQ